MSASCQLIILTNSNPYLPSASSLSRLSRHLGGWTDFWSGSQTELISLPLFCHVWASSVWIPSNQSDTYPSLTSSCCVMASSLVSGGGTTHTVDKDLLCSKNKNTAVSHCFYTGIFYRHYHSDLFVLFSVINDLINHFK